MKLLRHDTYFSRSPRFNPRVGHPEFVVHELALGGFLTEHFTFSWQLSFHAHLPSGQHNLRPQVQGKHVVPHLPQKSPASGWMSSVKSDSVKINTFVRHNPNICDFLWLLHEEVECWIYKITHSVSEFARLLLWRAADWLHSLPMCKAVWYHRKVQSKCCDEVNDKCCSHVHRKSYMFSL